MSEQRADDTPWAQIHDERDFLQPQLDLCPVPWSGSMRVTFVWTPGHGRHDLFGFGGGERAFSQYASSGDRLAAGHHDRGYLLDFTASATVRLHRCDGDGRVVTLDRAELPEPDRAQHPTEITVDGPRLLVSVGDVPVIACQDAAYRGGLLCMSRRIRADMSPSSLLSRLDPDNPGLMPPAFTRLTVRRLPPSVSERGGV